MDENGEKAGNYTVPALLRGLRILEMFDTDNRVLGTHDFAANLGVSVSAIYRIVTTLVELGYLQKSGKNAYQLGPKIISLGFEYLCSRDVTEIAAERMNALRDATSLSCHLGIREGLDTLYVHRAFASQRLTVNVPVGTRIPCHRSAMGRVLLTALTASELEILYRDVRLDDHAGPGPRTLPELKRLIEEDRTRGWTISRSDYATAIATGIRDHAGELVAAINLSGPDAVMQDDERVVEMTEMLIDTARSISAELGHSAKTKQQNRA